MRRFHSYGPVNPHLHFCVPRADLIQQCVDQLVGEPEDGGHFFTIWAPRQTGKTWLMRRAIAEIRARYGDRFLVGTISMQDIEFVNNEEEDETFFNHVPQFLRDGFQLRLPSAPTSWSDWGRLFKRETTPFGEERPLILLIDEFDRLPPQMIDRLVGQFRSLHLSRESSVLHGLALIGVRAVLGVDSTRGSPFNVQRSLHVPNLTHDEVAEMFRQYQEESGQVVESLVVDTLHDLVRGQPGLIGWFGELLTEKYNPGKPQPITMDTWARVYAAACQVEPNNTLLNLLKKASGPYLPRVLEIFGRTDIPFSFGQDWCNFLCLNGIIEPQEIVDARGVRLHVCRFASPFIQQRLFSDLNAEVLEPERDLPLPPLDALDDVLTSSGIVVPPLLERYIAYLQRLAARGHNPWKQQPRREDLRHTEAVGHFHLYNWLCAALKDACVVSPEFPTGNGTVDLVLQWEGHMALIEVKSFTNLRHLKAGQEQAAGYAARLGLSMATVAVFIPIQDPAVLQQLSTTRVIGAITVSTVAIAWDR